MPIIIGTPVVVPPVVQPPIVVQPPPVAAVVGPGLVSTWTGYNGSVFNLTDDTSGTFLLKGVRGLGMPDTTHFRREAPAVAGSRWVGARTTARDVLWPLAIWHDSRGAAFIARDDGFWATMNPLYTGTWSVTTPAGGVRSLDLRYESDDGTYDNDPVRFGWAIYAINLIADQPYWRGPQLTTPVFSTAAPNPFFGPPGVINISDATTLTEATITNPGDVPGWMTWTITGPVMSATVGTAKATIPIDTLLAGETLTVYTQPDQLIAIDNRGFERTLSPLAKFAPIPAGGTTTLNLSLVGAGAGASIQGSLVPYYYRAF